MFRENSSLLTENCEILFCKNVNISILAKTVTKKIIDLKIFVYGKNWFFRKIYVIFVYFTSDLLNWRRGISRKFSSKMWKWTISFQSLGEGQSALIHFLPKSCRKTITSLHLTKSYRCTEKYSEVSLPNKLTADEIKKTGNTGQSTFSGFPAEDFLL